MDKNTVLELAGVTAVGVLLAKLTQQNSYLNENKTVTRTALYVLGYYVATNLRPAGGYKMLEG